ncbi:TetR/AcrR family transcriptional regulator [Arthrobacter sp. UKPF54-2]|uniref:TetR/AcrR family transcriptional regulator n=1 Tax=Arthrobacter sp. UKPF54-2 TaxID=2600159 RepID=UPI0011B16F5B|nr:TetR/AcrR family transcriptional regulator [Arthrobacter sp. UKPF54-2]QDY89930.1 TetR/AcrR family transcriptional regulator [Arthrobacter sp. UKPF54-2]
MPQTASAPPVEPSITPSTPRARARERTIQDIVRIGREHLALHGAAALSLRAVARELGVVSSAVYRYVESREELLTLLLVDAYNELGDAVDAAVGARPEGDFEGRFEALGGAVRAWAVAQPASYALLFGSPVPGYQAPSERTMVPGTRVINSLMTLLDGAYRSGLLAVPDDRAAVVPALAADLERIRSEAGLEVPDELLARGALVWTSLFGAISFEVFGQYGADTFAARDELFAHHLAVLAGIAGLRS